MEQLQGFERGKDMVWKLDRSLYGLKQAPRAWCRTLDSILTRFNMQDCKTAKYPLRAKTIVKPRAADEEKANLALYLAVIGSLMYAKLGTRPDIAYAVGLLGRIPSDPSIEHWIAACGVLMYLKHTRTLGIEFSDGQTELDGFSDADFATSDPSRRRVTRGYCFRLRGGPISWQSKRQPAVIAEVTNDAAISARSNLATNRSSIYAEQSDLTFILTPLP
jgi:hypothetical protein